MKVIVHLYSQSQPIVHEGVVNAYLKGTLYCVMVGDGKTVFKYPTEHIFQITEEEAPSPAA